MPAGRPPIPTAIKILNGNPGKRALGAKEPKPLFCEPDMPEGMSLAAQKVWARLTVQLLALGVLGDSDGDSLSELCRVTAKLDQVRRRLRKQGDVIKSPRGASVLNPLVYIEEKLARRKMMWLTYFGLNPAARSKVEVIGGPSKPTATGAVELSMGDYLSAKKGA